MHSIMLIIEHRSSATKATAPLRPQYPYVHCARPSARRPPVATTSDRNCSSSPPPSLHTPHRSAPQRGREWDGQNTPKPRLGLFPPQICPPPSSPPPRPLPQKASSSLHVKAQSSRFTVAQISSGGRAQGRVRGGRGDRVRLRGAQGGPGLLAAHGGRGRVCGGLLRHGAVLGVRRDKVLAEC